MEPAFSNQALFDAFMAVPENKVGEIINGELVVQPRPAPKHAYAYSQIGVELGKRYQSTQDGWVFFDEPELHLDDQILVPDLAAWRNEKMSALPETAFFETSPDWVCEILSPTTAKYDRGAKREIYGEKGVQYLWFIDPVLQTLEAFEFKDGHWVLLKSMADKGDVTIAPFDTDAFLLETLWFGAEDEAG